MSTWRGGNLPRPVTSFVGRRHETEAAYRLLGRDRLVTLTGVGGVGKTRLALQAAAAVAGDYPDGVWWCDLAPADPDAVGHTVAGGPWRAATSRPRSGNQGVTPDRQLSSSRRQTCCSCCFGAA